MHELIAASPNQEITLKKLATKILSKHEGNKNLTDKKVQIKMVEIMAKIKYDDNIGIKYRKQGMVTETIVYKK